MGSILDAAIRFGRLDGLAESFIKHCEHRFYRPPRPALVKWFKGGTRKVVLSPARSLSASFHI